jgi:hypothetical protein
MKHTPLDGEIKQFLRSLLEKWHNSSDGRRADVDMVLKLQLDLRKHFVCLSSIP